MKRNESEKNPTIPEAQLPALKILLTNDQAKIHEEVNSDILTTTNNTENKLDNREGDDSENSTQVSNLSAEPESNKA